MKNFRNIIFTASGLILPNLYHLVLSSILDEGRQVSDTDRAKAKRLCELITRGQYKFQDEPELAQGFYRAEKVLSSRVGFVRSRNQLIDVISELKNQNLPITISLELPREWAENQLDYAGVLILFNTVVYISELFSINSTKSFIQCLIEKELIIAGETLLISADPIHTSEAIRNKIDAIVYVDAYRMRRELSLRKVI